MVTPITSLSDARHPVWKLLRSGVVGGLALAALSLFYDRLDSRDIGTILTLMGGVLGFDFAKDRMAQQPKAQEEGES
jgi:hypothetical protein